MTYIAVDFETTGLDCFTNQIIEIGAIKFNKEGEVLGEYQKLIKPTCKIENGAKRVHKITDKMLANESSIEDVWQDFIEWCGDFIGFVAHNARFEAGFITRLYPEELPDFKLIDTLKIARNRLPKQDSYKLQSLIPSLKDAHRALPDAIATKDLLLKLISTYKNGKLPETQLKSIYEMKPKKVSNEPTVKQLGYIKGLGGNPEKVKTKQEASEYIEKLKYNSSSSEWGSIAKFFIYIGVIIMPYIFSWFTLNKSFSSKDRLYSFAWFATVMFIIFFF